MTRQGARALKFLMMFAAVFMFCNAFVAHEIVEIRLSAAFGAFSALFSWLYWWWEGRL